MSVAPVSDDATSGVDTNARHLSLFCCTICDSQFLCEDLCWLHGVIKHGEESLDVHISDRCPAKSAERVYQDTALLLARNALSHRRDRSIQTRIYDTLLSWEGSNEDNPIYGLTLAYGLRKALLHRLEQLGMKAEGNEELRKTLHDDDLQVALMLKATLQSPSRKHDVLRLRDSLAEQALGMVDIIIQNDDLWATYTGRNTAHRVTEHACLPLAFKQDLIRLNVRLCEASGRLPESAFISGVDLDSQNCVNCGGYSDIYKGRYGGQAVALKKFRVFVMQTKEQRAKLTKMLYREVLILRYLSHPHIASILGVDRDSFEGIPCIVSTWMFYGNLTSYIDRHNLDSARLCQLATEVSSGLVYLHAMNLVHGDLHGRNVLIDQHGHAVLSDFGLSNFSDSSSESGCTSTGAARWMAPEVLCPELCGLTRIQHAPASDMYSFGCILWQMYSGSVPFRTLNERQVIVEVSRGHQIERSSSLKQIPDAMWALMESCWSRDPKDRPSPVSAKLTLQMSSVVVQPSLRISHILQPIRSHSAKPNVQTKPRSRSCTDASSSDSSRPVRAARRSSTFPYRAGSSSRHARAFSSCSLSAQRLARVTTPKQCLGIPPVHPPTRTVQELVQLCGSEQGLVPQRHANELITGLGTCIPSDPIMFYVGEGQRCGIRCSDALNGKFNLLDGAHERFTFEDEWVVLKIMWPGYRDWINPIQMRAYASDKMPLTVERRRLAVCISEQVKQFVESSWKYVEGISCWRLGPGGIAFDDLEVVGIQRISPKSWQAHFRVVYT